VANPSYFIPGDVTRLRRLSFAVISLVNLIVYFPSLLHIPRADQVIFLADTAPYKDWWPLMRFVVSYNRTRLFNAGDVFLFRPLMFILMGTEKWLFGYRFVLWQLVGLILHLAVVWVLLKVLFLIRPGIAASAAAFFFSTLHIGQEMIIWHHINGYNLSLLFAIAALYCGCRYVITGPQAKRYLVTAIILSTLAVFTCEISIVIAPILGLYVFANGIYSKRASTGGSQTVSHLDPIKRTCFGVERGALALIIVPFLFFAVDRMDTTFWHPVAAQLPFPRLDVLTLVNTGRNWFLVVFVWLYSGIFPLLQDLMISGRLRWVLPPLVPVLHHIPVFLSVILGGIFVGLLAFHLTSSLLQGAKPANSRTHTMTFFVSTFFLFASFSAWSTFIVVFGRASERGLSYIWISLYYAYIFWAFMVVAIYTLWSWIGGGSNRRFSKFIQVSTWALLVSIACCNAYKVFITNVRMRDRFADSRLFIAQLNNLIAQHRNERDLSFKFISPAPGDEKLEWASKVGDPPGKVYRLSDLLFSEYLGSISPKYYLAVDGAMDLKIFSAKALPKTLPGFIDVQDATTSTSDSSYGPSRLFDGSLEPDSFWEAAGSPQWIRVHLGESTRLTEYIFYCGQVSDRMPKDWVVEASVDGEHWDIVDREVDQKNWRPFEGRLYKLTAPSLYMYYRFNFVGASGSLRIYELRLIHG
jgi:hypothetical protein